MKLIEYLKTGKKLYWKKLMKDSWLEWCDVRNFVRVKSSGEGESGDLREFLPDCNLDVLEKEVYEEPGFKKKFVDGFFYGRPFVERIIRFKETEVDILFEKKETLKYLAEGKSIFSKLLRDENKNPRLDTQSNLYIDSVIFLKGNSEYEDLSNICVIDGLHQVVMDFRLDGDFKEALMECLKRATYLPPEVDKEE